MKGEGGEREERRNEWSTVCRVCFGIYLFKILEVDHLPHTLLQLGLINIHL